MRTVALQTKESRTAPQSRSRAERARSRTISAWVSGVRCWAWCPAAIREKGSALRLCRRSRPSLWLEYSWSNDMAEAAAGHSSMQATIRAVAFHYPLNSSGTPKCDLYRGEKATDVPIKHIGSRICGRGKICRHSRGSPDGCPVNVTPAGEKSARHG